MSELPPSYTPADLPGCPAPPPPPIQLSPIEVPCSDCSGTGIALWSMYYDAKGVLHKIPYLACSCRTRRIFP